MIFEKHVANTENPRPISDPRPISKKFKIDIELKDFFILKKIQEDIKIIKKNIEDLNKNNGEDTVIMKNLDKNIKIIKNDPENLKKNNREVQKKIKRIKETMGKAVAEIVQKGWSETLKSETLKDENLIDKYTKERSSKMENLNFSDALEKLKKENHLCRKSWNEDKVFIFLVKKHDLPLKDKNVTNFTRGKTLPFIVMNTSEGKLVPWTPGQTDLLANDWKVFK